MISQSTDKLAVILVGNYLPDQQQSMQRYAELLCVALTARGHHAEILRPEPHLGRLWPGTAGLGKWVGYLDKYIFFPIRLRRMVHSRPGVVVHICDHSNAMYVAHLRGVPHLVTCHDLLAIRSALGHFPQNRTGWTGRRLQAWILSGLRQSFRIVCVSAETRRQLLAMPDFVGKPVEVVPNGLNYPYKPLSDTDSRMCFKARPVLAPFVDRPYVFFIGGTQWYKNRAGLLRIFLRYAEANPAGADLLFAGKPFTSADEEILVSCPTKFRSRIHHVGSPDNEGLHALYARAQCLLFPSLEEGFGWPLIEAMSTGCRVLTSRRPPMNEVGGEAAAYLDPLDEAGAACALARLLGETDEARTVRIAAGRIQAARFSTSSMIDAIIANYRAVLAA